MELKVGAGTKTLFTLAALVIIAIGFKWAEALLVPLLLAAFVAASTAPIVRWMERARVPTFIAVTSTILILLALICGFAALTTLAATDLAESLPRLDQRLAYVKREFVEWLTAHSLMRFSPMVMRLDPGELSERFVEGLVTEMPGATSTFGVVLFVAIFILLEVTMLQHKLKRALNWRTDRFVAARNAADEVQKYLLVKTWISALMGLLCGVWCALLHVDNPVLWGLVTFAFNFVPVFGPFLATLGPFAVATLELGPLRALAVLGGLLVIHNVIANLVEPKVFGRTLGLSPLVVVLAIVVWGWVLGPVGALLSVPLTMVIKIILAHTEDLHWLAILLGTGDGRDALKYVETRRPSGQTPKLPPTTPLEHV